MNAYNEQQGFTAADMADQYATAFERGRESVLAELHAAAPATYFPLTLRGLIAYGQVAADPSQGAVPNHMRYLIEQMVPHLKRLDEIESSTPAAPGIDLAAEIESLKWQLDRANNAIEVLTRTQNVREKVSEVIDASPKGDHFVDATKMVQDSPKGGSAPCAWTDDGEGNWDTACGGRFILLEGSPADNKMHHCPFCGNGISEAQAGDAEVQP